MDLSPNGLLEELLGPSSTPKRESLSLNNNNTTTTSSNFSTGLIMSSSDQFFSNTSWPFDAFEETPIFPISSSSSSSSTSNPSYPNPFLNFSTLLHSNHSDQSDPNISHFTSNHNYPFVVSDTIITPFVEDGQDQFVFNLGLNEFFEDTTNNITNNVDHDNDSIAKIGCKVETLEQPQQEVGSEVKKGIKPKKLEGQPSKNLMAERRRRKRLNDRLSMLRSIVPKISKMDRTSILGDTIDYMKELLERISKLQGSTNDEKFNLLGISNNEIIKPNEVLIRNSPKFDVDRREMDTKVEMCCGAKPGLLISTVNTLESQGLEIQHCVISCFNDFSLQASCSEVAEQRSLISCEDIKQAIFRNAGYGGRCL